MIEEEPIGVAAPAEAGGAAHYAETLLYDFGKFMTSLALIVLGGVLTFAPSTRLALPQERLSLAITLGAVVLAGVSGLTVVAGIVTARGQGKAPKAYLRHSAAAGLGFLGMGIGMFVMAWIDR